MSNRLLTLTVNGRQRELLAADGALLIEVLRDDLGLTGTKRGCDGGECGACTVLVDDRPRLACSTLAAKRNSSASSMPSAAMIDVTAGFPSVSVPVLSITSVSTFSMRSRLSAFLIKTPD